MDTSGTLLKKWKHCKDNMFYQIRKFQMDCGPKLGVNPNRMALACSVENIKMMIYLWTSKFQK